MKTNQIKTTDVKARASQLKTAQNVEVTRISVIFD